MKLYDVRPLRNCDASELMVMFCVGFRSLFWPQNSVMGHGKMKLQKSQKEKTGFRFSFKAYGSAVERFVCNFCETLAQTKCSLVTVSELQRF